MSPFNFIQFECILKINSEPSACEYKQMLLCNETAIKMIRLKRKGRMKIYNKKIYVHCTSIKYNDLIHQNNNFLQIIVSYLLHR